MKKIMIWIDKNLEITLSAIFLLMMIIIGSMQIIGRYTPITPFPWTEEIVRYIFIWLVFISVGYCIKKKSHVRITFIKNIFSIKIGYIFDIFSDICFIVFAILCFLPSVDIVQKMLASGQVAATMTFFPIWLLYIVMPIGLIAIIARAIQDIVLTMRKFNNPDLDIEDVPSSKEN